MVWSVLVVDGYLMAARVRKSYLGKAEISSAVCTWLNLRMGTQGDLCVLLQVNPGVRRVHLVSQL